MIFLPYVAAVALPFAFFASPRLTHFAIIKHSSGGGGSNSVQQASKRQAKQAISHIAAAAAAAAFLSASHPNEAGGSVQTLTRRYQVALAVALMPNATHHSSGVRARSQPGQHGRRINSCISNSL